MAGPVTPDWNDLRPFLALARAGSLAGAARALGTRHSTVSRRIEALEQALGTGLVRRTAAGAVLTEAGLRLLPLAQAAERAMAEFVAAAQGVPRVWRLSLPTGLAPLIAGALAALQAGRPDLAVEVQSSSQPADIARGEADIALRAGAVTVGDLVVRKVGEAGWSLYASAGYLAAHPFEGGLSGHRVIGFHADLAGSPADRWLADHGAGAQMVLRLAQMTDLVATAREGLGIGLLPCLLADDAAAGLTRLVPEVLVRQPVLLVCRRDVADDPRGRALNRCLAQAVRRAGPALLGETG